MRVAVPTEVLALPQGAVYERRGSCWVTPHEPPVLYSGSGMDAPMGYQDLAAIRRDISSCLTGHCNQERSQTFSGRIAPAMAEKTDNTVLELSLVVLDLSDFKGWYLKNFTGQQRDRAIYGAIDFLTIKA